MISKNNSIKVKNTLNITGARYGVIVIRAGVFVVTLFAFANIALALNWQDKQVKKAGCSEISIGVWDSEILSLHNEKIINIQDNKIIIIDNHNSDKYSLHNKNSFKIGEKLIEFNINTGDRKKEVYLKVWPNLIATKIDYENSNNNSHNC
jgi:hypothetical protein